MVKVFKYSFILKDEISGSENGVEVSIPSYLHTTVCTSLRRASCAVIRIMTAEFSLQVTSLGTACQNFGYKEPRTLEFKTHKF